MDINFTGGGTAEEGARRDVPDSTQNYPEINIFGILPDGRAFKGKVVLERADDDTFLIVLSAKTGDDKLEDTGKFCRVKE